MGKPSQTDTGEAFLSGLGLGLCPKARAFTHQPKVTVEVLIIRINVSASFESYRAPAHRRAIVSNESIPAPQPSRCAFICTLPFNPPEEAKCKAMVQTQPRQRGASESLQDPLWKALYFFFLPFLCMCVFPG